MPERTWSSDSVSYKYGFNTQEQDNEIYGVGNSYTAEYWQYDSRLGRRWNVDPRQVPSFSPYACFANNPIWFSDVMGDTAQSSGTTVEPVTTVELPVRQLKDVVIQEKLKKTFWQKVSSVTREVVSYIPVAGGLVHAVESALRGDWQGVASGLGEAALDAVLLVTTGGIGNLAKMGVKAGVNIIAKQAVGNYVASNASEGVAELGVPTGVQIAAGVLLGIHKKPKYLNKSLPSIDATGKVHGTLPKVKDFRKYSKEELRILLNELRQSVQKRIAETTRLGSDKGHGRRQGAEQDLIKSLEKYLGQ
jgi:hypothetical protein